MQRGEQAVEQAQTRVIEIFPDGDSGGGGDRNEPEDHHPANRAPAHLHQQDRNEDRNDKVSASDRKAVEERVAEGRVGERISGYILEILQPDVLRRLDEIVSLEGDHEGKSTGNQPKKNWKKSAGRVNPQAAIRRYL